MTMMDFFVSPKGCKKRFSTTEKVADMFHLKLGEWHWHCSDKFKDFTPPADPSDLLGEVENVQKRRRSVVFCRNGLFFKWEKYSPCGLIKLCKRYLSPSIAKEFFTLRKLQRCGFAVTPPVAYAVSKNAGIWVTQEVAGARSVMEYICQKYEKNEVLTKEFLTSWGKFWGAVLNSGFYFYDFHSGNMLYVEQEQRFVLVDVQGVRKPWIISRKQKERMILKHIRDVMEFLSIDNLKIVLKSSGIAENEKEFSKFIQFYAIKAEETLKRHLRTFDEYTIRHRPDRKEWNFPETDERILPEDVIDDIWMNDFALQRHGIPHLHLLERNGNNLKIEKRFSAAPQDEEMVLRKRLEAAGYDPNSYIYCLNAGNRSVVCHKKVFL